MPRGSCAQDVVDEVPQGSCALVVDNGADCPLWVTGNISLIGRVLAGDQTFPHWPDNGGEMFSQSGEYEFFLECWCVPIIHPHGGGETLSQRGEYAIFAFCCMSVIAGSGGEVFT